MRADRGIVNTAGVNSFNNAGTVLKTGGTRSSPISIPFSNSGVVGSRIGAIGFGSTFAQSAGTTLLNGGNISKTNGSIELNGGELRGVGTITGNVHNTAAVVRLGIGTGTLTVSGNYNQLAGAAVDFEFACGRCMPGFR